jgi:putative ABC transport system permease protein
MTIVGVAPGGFKGTTLGIDPDVFAPITMRGFSRPFKGFDDRRNYWAYLFARLKPGLSLDQARAALAVPYHAIVNDVEAPLQKSMSSRPSRGSKRNRFCWTRAAAVRATSRRWRRHP